MRIQTVFNCALALMFAGFLSACTSSETKSADVRSDIRSSLDQAGLGAVSVDQDRDKGVVTLGGRVASEGEKAQAGAIATSKAAGQVVANQIEVVSPGNEGDSKSVNSELDKGIESNLRAAFIQKKLDDDVHFDVKNAVVTLTGEVNSPTLRLDAEKVAAGVPNVKQVVNELQLKNVKATTKD